MDGERILVAPLRSLWDRQPRTFIEPQERTVRPSDAGVRHFGPHGVRADQGSQALLRATRPGVATTTARGIVEAESLSGSAATRS